MGPEQSANPLIQFFPFILIGLVMYFIVLKPEKNKQNERKQKIASLKKNDSVITAGGIHGTVVNVKDTTITLRIDDTVKIEVDKEAVSTVVAK